MPTCSAGTLASPAPSPPPPYHRLTSQVTTDIELTAIAADSTARTSFEPEFKADVVAGAANLLYFTA